MTKIPYGGDFRPYLTIQDADSKSFCSKEKASVSDEVVMDINFF